MFERLRAWRTSVAKELGMPPYVIFHDSTLRLIAASPPSTLDELRQVNGVGATKLDKYGQAILDVLARPDRAFQRTAGAASHDMDAAFMLQEERVGNNPRPSGEVPGSGARTVTASVTALSAGFASR